MTDSRPPRCHYDRVTHQRMTTGHQPNCPGPHQCDGCIPCEHPHCGLCGHRHTNDQHPRTCDQCVGALRNDLDEIQTDCKLLRLQAAEAANDGHLAAAAPIPGADAMVLIGPNGDREHARNVYDTAQSGTLKKSRRWAHYADDHRPHDPIPPLSVLAWWEDLWRAHLGAPTTQRASVSRAVEYLKTNLTRMAQAAGGPDIADFKRDILGLRIQLEGTLHDERQPESGVECFECGEQLIRRIQPPRDKPCQHQTPARRDLRVRLQRRIESQAMAKALGLFDKPNETLTPDERLLLDHARRLPSPALMQAARMPCERCDQGGVKDPRPAMSWECPGCRKQYSPGEYHHAVKRDLLDGDGDGWTLIEAAAEALAEAPRPPTPAGIRKWMERGDVASCCVWEPGKRWGHRLVLWSDVRRLAMRSRRSTKRVSGASS